VNPRTLILLTCTLAAVVAPTPALADASSSTSGAAQVAPSDATAPTPPTQTTPVSTPPAATPTTPSPVTPPPKPTVHTRIAAVPSSTVADGTAPLRVRLSG